MCSYNNNIPTFNSGVEFVKTCQLLTKCSAHMFNNSRSHLSTASSVIAPFAFLADISFRVALIHCQVLKSIFILKANISQCSQPPKATCGEGPDPEATGQRSGDVQPGGGEGGTVGGLNTVALRL